MFSQNDRISARQLFRLLSLDIFGIASLLLPSILADKCRVDGIWAFIIGMVAGLLYLNLINSVLKRARYNYLDYLKQIMGNVLYMIFGVIYLIQFLLLGIYVLYTASMLIQRTLLQNVSVEIIAVILILLAAYAGCAGMEGRARVYEILFPILFICLAIMLLLATEAIDTDYWTPVFFSTVKEIGTGSYVVFAFFSMISILLFAAPYLKKKEQLKPVGKHVMIFLAVLLVILYLILIGNFQVNGVVVQNMSVITLMTMVPIPGNFLQRQDVFMVGFWFFCLFALLSTSVFYGKVILTHLAGQKENNWFMWINLILIYIGTIWLYRKLPGSDVIENYFLCIGIPVIVILPILVWIVGKRKEHKECPK